jgi:maleylpyruvate isomerase
VSESAGPHSVEVLIDQISAAVDRVLETAATLSDDSVAEPSLLPGWSRGHVLTHLARNADGLRNLLIWAKTGVETPQYVSLTARADDIAAGANRPAGELAADVASSGQAFIEVAHQLSDDAWLAQVRMSRGHQLPAWSVLSQRLFEVEVHHVDLNAGYGPANWPDWFVTSELYRLAGRLTGDPAAPSAVLTDAASGRQFFIHADGTSELAVTGPGGTLLAWLLGRDSGETLTTEPAGPLPSVPAF